MSEETSRGPRAARGEIRERLLSVAKAHFSTRDFASVTLRDIAREAGVDPGLVSYYFGGKTGLFREAMSLPRDPAALILTALDDSIEEAGSRAVRTALMLWETGTAENSARLLVRSVVDSEETMTTFRTWLDESVVTPIARRIKGPNAKVRAAAATTQVFGMLMMRYMTKIEPLASLSVDETVQIYAPIVQRLLTPGKVNAPEHTSRQPGA